jgi:hypothetical protein
MCPYFVSLCLQFIVVQCDMYWVRGLGDVMSPPNTLSIWNAVGLAHSHTLVAYCPTTYSCSRFFFFRVISCTICLCRVHARAYVSFIIFFLKALFNNKDQSYLSLSIHYTFVPYLTVMWHTVRFLYRSPTFFHKTYYFRIYLCIRNVKHV